MDEKALFSVIILHLYFHPYAFISLQSYLMLPLPSISLSLSLSPQIIANHHMQSISFASGGDPVSPINSVQISLWTFSVFSLCSRLTFLPSCCVSLSICLNTTHRTHCWFAVGFFFPTLNSLCSVISFSDSFFLFLFFSLSFMFFCPSSLSSNRLLLSSVGHSRVCSICGQRPCQPERWAETG